MANHNKSHRRARVAVLMVLCSAVFAAFFARLAWMQFVKADYYADKAAEASSASYTVTQHAARGPILDAGGTVLARDATVYDIYLRIPAPPGTDLRKTVQTIEELTGSKDVETQLAAFFAAASAGELPVIPDMLPLTQTAFDLFDKKKQEEKYYMDGHRMWNRMMEYMDDRKRVYRFTDWGLSRGMEGICPTLLAAMGSRFERIPFFYDDFSVRLMTPRECARLQGFPESFILPKENEKQVYKQIGNSVCVPVVSRIAGNIVKALN